MLTQKNATNSVASPLKVHVQYIKGLSFENPTPLASFMNESNVQPSISVGIQVKAETIGGRNFEVVLDICIDATREKIPLFIVKLSYAGIITLSDTIKEADAPPLLMIEGPRLLFPFARNILADITRDGGFPPLMLETVDFGVRYKQQKHKESQKRKIVKKQENSPKAAKTISLLNGATKSQRRGKKKLRGFAS